MREALDCDRLAMVSRDEAAKSAHAALHPIQDLAPEMTVAGAALLFATLCHRLGLDPAALHTQAMRMLRHEEGHFKTNDALQSLRDFAGIRLGGEDGVSIA